METLVVYDSNYGNTRRLAETMAEAITAHGTVRILGLQSVVPTDLGVVDLLIVGGPTQEHGLSPRMRQFTDALSASPDTRLIAATFDTRYRMPIAMSGSAARRIARRLKQRGIHVFVEPESFFVSRTGHDLESGEIERATAWAGRVSNSCALSRWCAA